MCSNVGICHWFSIGIVLVTLALKCYPVSSQVPLDELFPFGEAHNDTANERKDDGGSKKILLQVKFPFYGHDYTSLYVNNNGLLTFEKKTDASNYKPENFPLTYNSSMIAPFWADVDIEDEGGNVTLRQTTNVTLLDRATKEVQKYFFLKKGFTWMLIATWYKVGYYGASKSGELRKNTFQLVLATNEEKSFVSFYYHALQWTTGSNSDGNSTTGLGGHPAQVGFNAGDGVNYLQVPGAQTDAAINLTHNSNVGIPGKWIFEVGESQIRDVHCSHDVGMQIEPNGRYMLGGEKFRITGPCYQLDTNVTARIAGTNTTFPCAVINFVYAKCVAPPIFKTGEMTLELDPYGISNWSYSAVLSLNNVVSMAPKVEREDIEQWIVGNTVKIHWNSTSLPSSHHATVDVMGFQYKDGVPDMIVVQSVSVQVNVSGSMFVEQTIFLSEFLKSYLAVAIRVSETYPTPKSLPEAIWSDFFPVRVSANWSSEVCAAWNTTDSLLPSITNDDVSCPCIAKQASRDTGRFEPDPLCRSDRAKLSTNCAYKPGAAQCFLRILQSESSTGVSCCYDNNGDIIDFRDSAGGGTCLRHTFRSQGNDFVSFFTYFENDVLPSLHCCQYAASSDMCQLFQKKRPPVTCELYETPTAAQGAGDPHLTTLDGQDYTFNGLGDFALIENKTSGVVVQVRAAQAQDTEGDIMTDATCGVGNPHSSRTPDLTFGFCEGKYQNASIFSGVAIAVTGVSDVVQVHRDTQTVSRVLINDVPLAIDQSTSPIQFQGITVQREHVDLTTDTILVVVESVDISVSLDVTADLINVLVLIGGDQLKGNLRGLLGNYNGNRSDDFISRNGQVLAPDASMREIHFDFGMTWEVPENESLFLNSTPQGMEKLDISNYVPVFLDEKTDQLPQRNGTDAMCGDIVQCKFDFQVTGNEAIAKSTAKFIENFKVLQEDLMKVVRCPFLETPENGKRNITGYAPGDNATFECNSGFEEIAGAIRRTCQESGTWSGTAIVCAEPVIRSEGFPQAFIVYGVGAAGVGVFIIIIVVCVIYHCNRRKPKKPDIEELAVPIDLHVIFAPSDIPQPVFQNEEFLEILQQLNSGGGFKIPRPSYVDPQIFDEYFF